MKGWNAGWFIGTPKRIAFRAVFFAIQSDLAGTSAGPSWPCASRSPAKRTGTGSIPTPCFAASPGSCVHAR